MIFLNPYWQIMENSFRNFPDIFIFRVVRQVVLLEKSSNFFFEISILRRHRGRFTGKLINKKSWLPIQFFPNLPILLKSSYHIWYVTIGLDEFSSKKACEFPNWRLDEFSSKTVSEISQKFSNLIPYLRRRYISMFICK